jgi:UDP-N-acetylmuramate--alanine ligase
MEIKSLDSFKDQTIHFIGIGGCSMSGLALILKNIGYHVTGSDMNESVFTEKLIKDGVDVSVGHHASHVDGAALCVYSAAIKSYNPEYSRATDLNIPMIDRASLLGLISNEYENVVCIAGCHGKTTITSMIALILQQANIDATVHIGGMVDFLGSGVMLGKEKKYFITEACEYVQSFLKLSPTHILVNNIDDDHLDCYRDIEHIYATFREFVNLMPKDGKLFLSRDDTLAYRLMETDYEKIEYGIKDDLGYSVANVSYSAMGCPAFDVLKDGEKFGRIELSVPGAYNMANALSAFSICCEIFGVDVKTAGKALYDYNLVGRRFEYMGEKNGVRVVHDYAHHPNEISACLDGAAKYPHEKLWVLFQCNSYTRAKTLKDKYATCFGQADTVIVPDIYPGRDIDKGEIHATDLVSAIDVNAKECVYIPTFEKINEYLDTHAKPGDLVLTLGSGDVYKQTNKLL